MKVVVIAATSLTVVPAGHSLYPRRSTLLGSQYDHLGSSWLSVSIAAGGLSSKVLERWCTGLRGNDNAFDRRYSGHKDSRESKIEIWTPRRRGLTA